MPLSWIVQKLFGPLYRMRLLLRKRKLKKAFASTEEISILSNNCVAGYMYKALGLRFCSPTIGLKMSPADFVKFCENLDDYLACELLECPEKTPQDYAFPPEASFPIASLGDLTIFLQHYTDFNSARDSWEKRKRLINKDRLYYILFLVQEREHCEAARKFAALPFRRKIILSDGPIPNCACNFALHFKGGNWFDHSGQGLFRKYSKNHYEKFDFVTWLSS